MTKEFEDRLLTRLELVCDSYIGPGWKDALIFDGEFGLRELKLICKIWEEEINANTTTSVETGSASDSAN